jgi:ATP-dependent DNA ligase
MRRRRPLIVDRLCYRQNDAIVFMCAFELIELDGDDLRRDPLAIRKATLANVLAAASPGLRFTSASLELLFCCNA